MVSLDSTAVRDGVSAQRSAGTPSLIREAVFQAAPALEFTRVLDVVAEYAAGPLGSARIRARRPSGATRRTAQRAGALSPRGRDW